MFQHDTTDKALFTRSVTVEMPLEEGLFDMTVVTENATGREHIILQMGEVEQQQAPIVRIHSECATGDLFGSKRCDCGPQLQYALQQISAAGHGLLIYLRQEGRGIGLSNKLMAYQLQDNGLDTVDANLALGFAADQRSYDIAVAILNSLQISSLRLLTNNPDKIAALEAEGIRVTQRLNIETGATRENRHYLAAKKARMGHLLSQGPDDVSALDAGSTSSAQSIGEELLRFEHPLARSITAT